MKLLAKDLLAHSMYCFQNALSGSTFLASIPAIILFYATFDLLMIAFYPFVPNIGINAAQNWMLGSGKSGTTEMTHARLDVTQCLTAILSIQSNLDICCYLVCLLWVLPTVA